MRISVVSPRCWPDVGGIETHVEQLAPRVAAAGHEVEILAQTSDRSREGLELLDGVIVRRFATLTGSAHYAFAPGLWRFLRANAHGYDIVHAHNYHALPALAAALAGPENLVFTPHYHGTSESRLRRVLHRPYRLAGGAILARTSRVICVSETEAALFRSHFPSAAEKIVVIPNGVDAAAIDAADGFRGEGIVILSAGRLEPYKQVDRAIQALSYLDRRFVLRVVGDGPSKPELENLADRVGVRDRVQFLGRVETAELYRWFKTAAVWVTMSTLEAMPITPLEVLAAGSRVIASDIPAHRYIRELTGGSVTLVPATFDPERLATAIQRAVVQDVLNPQILSWDDVARRTLDVYRHVPGLQVIPAMGVSA